MEFRILGPLEIVVDGRAIPALAPRLQTLLATLLLRPHRVVSVDELIDRLWPDDTQPANPKASLHTYVRRLREIVGADVLQTRGKGYLLAAEPTDLAIFRAAVSEAASDPAQEIMHLQRALDQWRGRALSVDPHVAVGLNEERLAATEQYYDARLARGDHADVLPDLQTLAAQEPLRERLGGLLMTALYRCGRQVEALSAYDAIAARLAEEFGLDPGDELRQLRQAILTSSLGSAAPPDDWHPQNQLPLDVRQLIGRDGLVAEVSKLICTTDGVPVVVLSGAPGVGKSALCIRAAHQLVDRFPDGQWFVRLRGASGQPRRPGDVLAELLRSSGVDPSVIPDDLDDRAAMFRARLADRSVLLVLDDARDAAQVRPLLPGRAGSAVLVTSRSALGGLIALDGAIGLRVSTLTDDDSAVLIRLLLDATDDDAVLSLVAACSGLPLALRIAGANAARGSIAEYVARMRTAGALPALTIDDEVAVSAAFQTSYELLEPAVQRGFRLLAQFPGAEFGRDAAAALVGADHELVVTSLEAASFLEPVGNDRYLMHDLVREYAGLLGPPDLDAWNALCSWYAGTANAAISQLFPAAVRLPITTYDGVVTGDPEAWLEGELANIEAIATEALRMGPAEIVWLLADIVRPYLYQHSLISIWRNLVELASAASPDALGRGAIEHAQGVLARITGDAVRATEHSARAIELYRESGFSVGEAALLCNLGLSYNDRGQLRKSSELLAAGIALFRSLGEVDRLPVALLNQSLNYLHLGQFRESIECATESLQLGLPGQGWVALVNRAAAYTDLGEYDKAEADMAVSPGSNRLDVISWHNSLAEVDRSRGDYPAALVHASEALDLSLEITSPYHECFSRLVLGEIHLSAGDLPAAQAQLDQVEVMAREAGYGTILADTHGWQAYCLFRAGDPEGAVELGLTALAELQAIEYAVGQFHVNTLLADCYRTLGRPGQAAVHQSAADEIRQRTGYVPA
ncbi:BTAD domain-containing putative transcriptional regulator [Kribbella sp. NPDC056345]|uniref:AfsR/SARP family transcriptional regulator n=1 Tax=Kribbella sp. NPDC056345 TaxID=3345789 RepID=UPI0035DAFC73